MNENRIKEIISSVINDTVNNIIKENRMQEYKISHTSEEDHQKAIDAMAAHMDTQDNGKVGIFWYDVRHKALFGVIAIDKDTFGDKPNVGGGLISCRELHAKVWAKNYNRQKFKYNGEGPFVGDYKDTPRGRVFYNLKTETYEIKVGNWINDHPDAIDEILNEFDLYDCNFEIIIDSHWDIGCGWENF